MMKNTGFVTTAWEGSTQVAAWTQFLPGSLLGSMVRVHSASEEARHFREVKRMLQTGFSRIRSCCDVPGILLGLSSRACQGPQMRRDAQYRKQ